MRMPKIPMFLYQDNLILVFRGCRCGHLAFTLSSEGFLYENTPNVFFHSTSFSEKYYLALARLEIFSKSRLRLNLGYGKSRLTFADKTPGQGKRKAATPEKLKYLSPLKGGLKPGSTIGYRSTRIVPISEKSGGFYPAGFTERLYPEIAYLNRVGGCIHALGIAVESPQPLGEDLEAESPTVYGNAQILQKKSVLIY